MSTRKVRFIINGRRKREAKVGVGIWKCKKCMWCMCLGLVGSMWKSSIRKKKKKAAKINRDGNHGRPKPFYRLVTVPLPFVFSFFLSTVDAQLKNNTTVTLDETTFSVLFFTVSVQTERNGTGKDTEARDRCSLVKTNKQKRRKWWQDWLLVRLEREGACTVMLQPTSHHILCLFLSLSLSLRRNPDSLNVPLTLRE